MASATLVAEKIAIATAAEVIETELNNEVPEIVTLRNGKKAPIGTVVMVRSELLKLQKDNPRGFEDLLTDCFEMQKMTPNEQGMILFPRFGHLIKVIKMEIILLSCGSYNVADKRYYANIKISSPLK